MEKFPGLKLDNQELHETMKVETSVMSPNGRPPIPLERKQKLGTLRNDRMPATGLTEVERSPEEEGIRTHNQLIRSYLLELKLLWF